MPAQIRLPQAASHEVGLHAWDHFSWQHRLEHFSAPQLDAQLRLGFDKLADILGAPPHCSAAAGWRCNSGALLAKEAFPFVYNSDCRGDSIFIPCLSNSSNGGRLLTPQIPVTLPTYDEVVGSNGITAENFNDYLLARVSPYHLNVYTIHAEVEGMALLDQFERLLEQARDRNMEFQPLGALVQNPIDNIGSLKKINMAGREGWMAAQDQQHRIAS
jgi:undecaprenyl phosphate-alpha-L-ara4FN deformylase